MPDHQPYGTSNQANGVGFIFYHSLGSVGGKPYTIWSAILLCGLTSVSKCTGREMEQKERQKRREGGWMCVMREGLPTHIQSVCADVWERQSGGRGKQRISDPHRELPFTKNTPPLKMEQLDRNAPPYPWPNKSARALIVFYVSRWPVILSFYKRHVHIF